MQTYPFSLYISEAHFVEFWLTASLIEKRLKSHYHAYHYVRYS